ncbi:hypothetical protein Golob_019870, partial [Gossypium lobatum]|nr:hypothetical protein [Gossypium lobatum]
RHCHRRKRTLKQERLFWCNKGDAPFEVTIVVVITQPINKPLPYRPDFDLYYAGTSVLHLGALLCPSRCQPSNENESWRYALFKWKVDHGYLMYSLAFSWGKCNKLHLHWVNDKDNCGIWEAAAVLPGNLFCMGHLCITMLVICSSYKYF